MHENTAVVSLRMPDSARNAEEEEREMERDVGVNDNHTESLYMTLSSS